MEDPFGLLVRFNASFEERLQTADGSDLVVLRDAGIALSEMVTEHISKFPKTSRSKLEMSKLSSLQGKLNQNIRKLNVRLEKDRV